MNSRSRGKVVPVHSEDDDDQKPDGAGGSRSSDELHHRGCIDKYVSTKSAKEWMGWYLFEIACTIHSTVFLGMYGPAIVFRMASNMAIESPSRTTPLPAGVAVTAKLCLPGAAGPTPCLRCQPGFGERVYVCNASTILDMSAACFKPLTPLKVDVVGTPVYAVGFTTVVLTISVGINILLLVGVGPCGDVGKLRKKMLTTAGFAGFSAAIFMYFCFSPWSFSISGMWLGMSSALIGFSHVFLDAFFPILIDSHPDVIALRQGSGQEGVSTEKSRHKRELVAVMVSAKGMLASYAGALVLTILSYLIVRHNAVDTSKMNGERVVCAVVGALGLGLGALTNGLLKAHETASALDADGDGHISEEERQRFCTQGCSRICAVLGDVTKYPHAMIMLGAHFLCSVETISTVVSLVVNDAQRQLCFSMSELNICFVLFLVGGMAGIVFSTALSLYCGVAHQNVMASNIIIFAFWCVYFYYNAGPSKLIQVQLFTLNMGAVVASLQSFSRILFADLVPRNRECEFFSLLSIVGKGSAWFFPAAMSLILTLGTDATRKGAYLFLSLLLLIPIGVLHYILDHRQGMRDAERLKDGGATSQEKRVQRKKKALAASASGGNNDASNGSRGSGLPRGGGRRNRDRGAGNGRRGNRFVDDDVHYEDAVDTSRYRGGERKANK